MDWQTLECPRCENRDQFLLSADKEKHLRQCSNCERWFVAETAVDSELDFHIEVLDQPPTCPVAGCTETLRSEELPAHIVEEHDAEFA
jgi:transcription elongation factor Elf1